MARLEGTFLKVAERLTGSTERIHYSYHSLASGAPRALPPEVRVLCFDPVAASAAEIRATAEYVRQHGIRILLGFDFPVHAPCYGALRQAGLAAMLSYWGAPMSKLNRGLTLLSKRAEVRLRRNRPDTFIFESRAMQRLATHGRGIPGHQTRLCPTGVDPVRFAPEPRGSAYAHAQLGIPPGRRVVLYSGHMEERKGVAVLIRAAIELVDRRGRRDLHVVLLGDRAGESEPYLAMLQGTAAADHVQFAGYRDDIQRLMGSAYLGVIPSTGWDSFPMSALEMGSSGIPVIGSRLHGIPETLEEGRTGLLFEPGDHVGLADAIATLLDDPAAHRAFSRRARERILGGFTTRHQVDRLFQVVHEVARNCGIVAPAHGKGCR